MPAESFRVAVLGAGLSGVCMGIKLKTQGITDFVILEKAAAVGLIMTLSVTGNDSPMVRSRAASNDCASSVPCRMNNKYPSA